MANEIGIIGLGTLGGPICRHLVKKSGQHIVAFDPSAQQLVQAAADGATAAASVRDVVDLCEMVFICLPHPSDQRCPVNMDSLRSIVDADILPALRSELTIVDLGTSSVQATRELAKQFAQRGAVWIDAPLARTADAAENATLKVMVGATQEQFAKVESLLRHFAIDITHCGPTGAGQCTKLLNNMVLFSTVTAIAEAIAVGRHNGIDARLLMDTLATGSADSFGLRHHGAKSIAPGDFSSWPFSVNYALRDVSYALDLAEQSRLSLRNAEHTRELFESAARQGLGDAYFPIIAQLIDPA